MLTDNITTEKQTGLLVSLLAHEYAEYLLEIAEEGTTFGNMRSEAERLIKIVCQNISSKDASDLIGTTLKDGKDKGFEAFLKLKSGLIIK